MRRNERSGNFEIRAHLGRAVGVLIPSQCLITTVRKRFNKLGRRAVSVRRTISNYSESARSVVAAVCVMSICVPIALLKLIVEIYLKQSI